MKYPAKNPAKFLKPEPEPDIEAGYPAGSGFSRISGRFLVRWTRKKYLGVQKAPGGQEAYKKNRKKSGDQLLVSLISM